MSAREVLWGIKDRLSFDEFYGRGTDQCVTDRTRLTAAVEAVLEVADDLAPTYHRHAQHIRAAIETALEGS